MSGDRIGLLWRPAHAADLLAHVDRLDVLEIIADDWIGRPRRALRALRTLASQVPVRLHSVGLGLASSEPVAQRRLDRLARVVGLVEPEAWSEHLAFVRGGGVEIGHLAAPPRRRETLEGTIRNVARAARTVGAPPLLENVATLLEPPASEMDEVAWTAAVLDGTGCRLLLDLHNLHANAVNFGVDVDAFLTAVGTHRVGQIHVAGGRLVERGSVRRLLDDHLHDVPGPVYDLLARLGGRGLGPVTVVLERDGAWPGAAALVEQVERARAALAAGRAAVAA